MKRPDLKYQPMFGDIGHMPPFVPCTALRVFLTLLVCACLSPVLFGQEGKSDDADAAFQKMVADPSSVPPEDMAATYLSYIEKMVHRKPDTGFVLYQEMVDFGKRIGNDDVIANGYASISFMHKLMGDLNAQIEYGLKVLPYRHDSILLALTMGDIGIAYLQKTNFDSAHFYIDSAFVIGSYLDSSWRSTFYLQKCQLLIRENKFHTALDYLLKSIPFVPEDNLIRRAELFARIAQIYRILGDLEKAIDYEKKAMHVSEGNGLERNVAIGHVRMGELYFRNGQDSMSRESMQASIPVSTERNYNSALLTAYSILTLLDLKSGDITSAGNNLAAADSVYALIPYKDNREDYYTAKIRYLIANGRITLARKWLDRFLAYASERNSKSTRLKALNELRALHAASNDWRSANELADTIQALRAEMNVAEQKQLVYDLEAKYQSDLKNAEIQRLRNERMIDQLEMERQRRRVWALLGGLVLAILAILGVWYAYRTKQLVNRELRKLNDELSKALEQNSLLIKEIHHRVKNNLQVVSSLLNLQGKFEKDATVLKAINTSKDRVQSISLLHKTLYDNQDLTSIQVRPYFNELLEHLVHSYLGQDNDLDLQTRIGNFQLDIDTLVPLGLIANELITNAFKYAFPMSAVPTLEFELTKEGSTITMAVKDNGPGLPVKSIPRRSRSLGMQLIYSFAERLDGKIDIDNSDGCRVALTFEQVLPESVTRIA